MNILAVDDEILQLDKLQESVRRAFPDAVVYAVNKPSEAILLINRVPFDFAFLDIQMRMMTGIELAAVLKTRCPELKVVFVTAYDEYRKSTEDVAPLAFILKPVNPQKIFDAVQNKSAQRGGTLAQSPGIMLYVKTSDTFQVYDRNNQPLRFTRSKARELFAYLVYRRGAFCSSEELINAVIGQEKIGQDNEAIFQNLVNDIQQTLQRSAAEGVLQRSSNQFAIDPDRIECDYYTNQKKYHLFSSFLKRGNASEYEWMEKRG